MSNYTKDEPTIDYYYGGRAVIHFLNIEDTNYGEDGIDAILRAYDRACEKAKPYGGERFHNKLYGGGIAFTSKDKALKCWNAVGMGAEA